MLNRGVLFATIVALVLSCMALPAWAEAIPRIGPEPAESSAKFSFVVLGDKTSGGEGKWPIFDKAVDAINLFAPDFVITVGDQIPGHMQERKEWDAEWAEYMDHAKRIESPLFLIPGNHDIANIECYRFWKEDFGRTYFAFNHQDCHFLVLNTEEERFDGRGPVWQAMLAFAEADLAAHKDARHTFVFFHKPMWDDPRHEDDWPRIQAALGPRPHSVFAGHEHYMSVDPRDGNPYILQSATGGGIDLSPVKEFGCFHSFTHVTVDENAVTYAVVETEGPIHSLDVAPASFRKAISFEMVALDVEAPIDFDRETSCISAVARLSNPLPEAATIRLSVSPLDECRWRPATSAMGEWQQSGAEITIDRLLQPGESTTVPLVFDVPSERLYHPPRVAHSVQYHGAWLNKENYPMQQEDVIPLHTPDCLRAVPEWKLAGPFLLGDLDTSHLPQSPELASPNLFKHFGPEEGFRPDRTYGDGLRWFDAESQGRGLLNFNALMGTLDHALGYALCGIYSPEAQRVHATLYSDNYHQALLNGTLLDEGRDFGAPAGFTHVPLELEAGWNTFIVKLVNNRGDWFLRVLIADPQGNLEFASHPPRR